MWQETTDLSRKLRVRFFVANSGDRHQCIVRTREEAKRKVLKWVLLIFIFLLPSRGPASFLSSESQQASCSAERLQV